jgi:hypothetical protein
MDVVERDGQLLAFVDRVRTRVDVYLTPRADQQEQRDHLQHVSNRTHWLFYSEQAREAAELGGAPVMMSRNDSLLIDACTATHDLGKWVPREALRALVPGDGPDWQRLADHLSLTEAQVALLQLGLTRRLSPADDRYWAEYDAAHHLVSALIATRDPELDINALHPADQDLILKAVVGHQFGSYYKRTLFAMSLTDEAITPAILVDISRPQDIIGHRLASTFHDGDISDLLYVGSVERRPYREDLLHGGGLVKILLINLTLAAAHLPIGPRTLADCLTSCQATVDSACKEFLTPTARHDGEQMRARANRYLAWMAEPEVATRINALLHEGERPAAERLKAIRLLINVKTRDFLLSPEGRE